MASKSSQDDNCLPVVMARDDESRREVIERRKKARQLDMVRIHHVNFVCRSQVCKGDNQIVWSFVRHTFSIDALRTRVYVL